MALDSVTQAGTQALQKSLQNLQRNADEVAKLVRNDSDTQAEIEANQETGVVPENNEALTGSLNEPTSIERTTDLLVQQKNLAVEFDAIAAVVSTTGKVLGNFIDEMV